MKTKILTLTLAALTVGLLGSCSKINERIDGLDKRINNLENDKIASVEQQIAAINQSIADLETIRTNIQVLIDAKNEMGEDITDLKAADQILEGKINDLKTYVDTELAKYATTDWVNGTFATLEKQNEIMADIEQLKQDLDTELDQAIANLETSLKSWVNEQLSGYYTTAQMEAKVKALQDQIDALKTDNETNKSDIEELEAGLAQLKQDLASAKAAIKTAYEKAIEDALKSNDGYITEKIKTDINSANGRISNLYGRVGQVEALLEDVNALKGMVQSVTIIPAYNDGSVKAINGILYLDIIVEPSEAVATLTEDNLKILVNGVKTKAFSVDTVAVTNLKVDAAKGTITARADISSKLPLESGKALTAAVNVKNGISDYTTKFYPVEVLAESNVTITAAQVGTDSTKVNIAADADFPESVMGNIVVADGFKSSNPTSITIEGIGTVTFDKNATAKILANAEEAQATNVFFKVEDVTSTMSVPNADVVLEVTMKTVDENGTEVYSANNAAGVVTIEIPLAEDVVYVNSVTLVNDAGEVQTGGVVDGSVEFDEINHTLTFKVNHFSKYAVDYVKSSEFEHVTNVILNKNVLTLTVGAEETLTATVLPENATNKEVTWTSSAPTVATVDETTGKVTAVAAGTATITAKATDGSNQQATCTVTVTATIADVLATVVGGFPKDISGGTTPVAPSNPWTNGNGSSAFIYSSALILQHDGYTYGQLTTTVTKGENCYNASISYGNLKFNMTNGILTSFEFIPDQSKPNAANYAGTYTAPVVVTNVSLNKNDLPLTVGAEETLTATVLPENATNKAVTWSSSDTNVATVDDSGMVTAVAPGEAIITVTTADGSKTNTCTVTVTAPEPGPELPAGALSGEFTVNEGGKTVHFSQGNLVATIDDSGVPTAWKFATNQYDYIGEGGANKTIGIAEGDVDLFGWSTASTTYGISTSNSSVDYSGGFVDWGKNIGDGSTWRTLSKDEWTYLFNTTSRMVNSKPCYSNAVSGVSIGGTTYKGVFIYPDNYNGDEVSDSMTWDQINAAGIVFLPAAGYREDSTVKHVGSGYYWSSTADDDYDAYSVDFDSDDVSPDNGDARSSGSSVRLVTEVPAAGDPGNGTEQYNNNSNPDWFSE